MIINASGRTDICAFYSKWFIDKIEKGFVDVKNPFFPNLIKRIYLNKENIDAIVFCTKNPIPMIKYMNKLQDYFTIFHVTITPYKSDIEPNVKNKNNIIKSVIYLSNLIGKGRIFLRYDPIIINEKYSVEYHAKAFERLIKVLGKYVNRVIISFVDIKKNTRNHNIRELSLEEIYLIADLFGKIGKKYNVIIQMCAEKYDLSKYGIINESCLSPVIFYNLTGKIVKDKNKNRINCNCIKSIDIGFYNSCMHLCKYCYANYDECNVKNNYLKINKEEW